MLEFGQLGLPVILNRTPMHEALLGADYPLFAASLDDVADVAAACVADPAVFALAAARTSAAAREFTLDQAADRLRGYLARAVGPSAGAAAVGEAPASPPLRVVIAGHDLKFFTPLIAYFRLQPASRSGSTSGRRSASTTRPSPRSWPNGPTSSSASGAARTPSGTAATSAATPG